MHTHECVIIHSWDTGNDQFLKIGDGIAGDTARPAAAAALQGVRHR